MNPKCSLHARHRGGSITREAELALPNSLNRAPATVPRNAVRAFTSAPCTPPSEIVCDSRFHFHKPCCCQCTTLGFTLNSTARGYVGLWCGEKSIAVENFAHHDAPPYKIEWGNRQVRLLQAAGTAIQSFSTQEVRTSSIVLPHCLVEKCTLPNAILQLLAPYGLDKPRPCISPLQAATTPDS